MAGLLDFLFGGQGSSGLLGGYGGPAYPNGGVGDPSGAQAPQVMAQAQPPMMQGQEAQPTTTQGQGLPAFGGGNPLFGMLAGLNPEAANAIYQRQMMQSAFQSLPASMPFAQKLAILQNPKIQESLYGINSLGAGKTPGGYEGQIVSNAGRIGMAFPTANGQAPADAGVRTVKPFESVIDLSKGPQADASQGQGQSAQPPQPGQGNVLYSNNGALDNNTVDYTARQLIAGDDSGLKNNRTTEGAMFNAAVRQRAVQLAQKSGIQPEELASRNAEYKGYNSAQTTLGNRLGTVSLAINEAKQLIPQALTASDNVKRALGGQYMPVNKMVNAYQENTGDPNIIKLGAALYGLAHTYARAVNPTGAIADADVARAYKILDTGLSKGQLSGGISQIFTEMQAAGKSPGAVKEEFRQQFTNNAGLAAGKNKPQDNDPFGLRSSSSGNDPLGIR